MAKIKLENEHVIVYYSQMGSGLYETVKNYKINLSNKKHFFVKGESEQEIDWSFSEHDEQMMVENLIKEVKFKIENNYIVIGSYKNQNDTKEVEKNESHLEKNKKILNFLEKYSF